MKRGLLVGINYIGTDLELRGCVNDVRNVNNFLLSIGYLQKNIRRLTDNTIQKPTKQNITTNLINMINNANTGDELFFLYSGHGTQITDTSGDELGGGGGGVGGFGGGGGQGQCVSTNRFYCKWFYIR